MMRPYPWKCRTCGEKSVSPMQADYQASIEHDGRLYSFVVPQLNYLECASCNAKTLPTELLEKVYDALRTEAGLYQPSEIREKRQSLNLTQEELANYLNVAKETISRWETGGQIQQRSSDRLLRLFFDVPQVRSYLENQNVSNENMVTSNGSTKRLLDTDPISKTGSRLTAELQK